MYNHIISYEVNKIDQNSNALAAAIRSLGPWIKMQKTVWFVTTTKTAEETRAHLDKYIDPNDLIFVLEVKNDSGFSWRLHPDVNKYLIEAREV